MHVCYSPWGRCSYRSRTHATETMDILSMSTIVYGLATYVFTI
jgi:hypothetical protein